MYYTMFHLSLKSFNEHNQRALWPTNMLSVFLWRDADVLMEILQITWNIEIMSHQKVFSF